MSNDSDKKPNVGDIVWIENPRMIKIYKLHTEDDEIIYIGPVKIKRILEWKNGKYYFEVSVPIARKKKTYIPEKITYYITKNDLVGLKIIEQ